MEKETIIDTKLNNKKALKPCKILGFCPYGKLVENFPITNTKYSCKVFGHNCPIFSNIDFIAEYKATEKEQDNFAGYLIKNNAKTLVDRK